MCQSQSLLELSYSFSNQTLFKAEVNTTTESTSRDSLVFYTPEGSSNTSEVFKCSYSPSPEGDNYILANISNFQPSEQTFEPLISRKSTDFICNLNPPNSNFIIGTSASRSGKLSLLPLPHTPRPVLPSTASVSSCKHRNRNKPKIQSKSTTWKSVQNTTLCNATRKYSDNKTPLNATSSPSSKKFCQTGSTKSHTENHRNNHHSRPNNIDQYYKHNPKSIFKCDQCANSYSLEYWYLLHLQKHKDNSLYHCNICDLSFINLSTLRYHKPIHYSNEMLRRSKRNSLLPSSFQDGNCDQAEILVMGLSDKHNSFPISYKVQVENGENSTNILSISPNGFERKLLNGSLPLIHNTDSVVKSGNKKKRVGYKLRSKSLLINTVLSQRDHNSKLDSDYIPPNKNYPISTATRESITKDFSCETCQRCFVSEHALKVHRSFHRRVLNNQGKSSKPNHYSARNNLNAPITINNSQIHTNPSDEVSCPFCDRTFKSQRAKNIHCFVHKEKQIDTHTDETTQQTPRLNLRTASKKLSPCKLCECDSPELDSYHKPRFSNSHDTLRTSEGDVNDAPKENLIHNHPYFCPYCSQSFRFLKSYMRHLPSHNEKKPYNSTEKDKIDSTRPFKCRQCIGRFGNRSGLRSHELMHLIEKPYSCEFCPRTFVTRSHQKAHTRVHTGEKPFGCSECSMRYSHKCSLKTHFNKSHLTNASFT